MQVTDERNLETIPVGPLGIIPLESCKELGDKVNSYLVAWRNEREHEHKSNIAFKGFEVSFSNMVSSLPPAIFSRPPPIMFIP